MPTRKHGNANERGQMLPRQGKWVKIPLLTGNQPRNPREPLRGNDIVIFEIFVTSFTYLRISKIL